MKKRRLPDVQLLSVIATTTGVHINVPVGQRLDHIEATVANRHLESLGRYVGNTIRQATVVFPSVMNAIPQATVPTVMNTMPPATDVSVDLDLLDEEDDGAMAARLQDDYDREASGALEAADVAFAREVFEGPGNFLPGDEWRGRYFP